MTRWVCICLLLGCGASSTKDLEPSVDAGVVSASDAGVQGSGLQYDGSIKYRRVR
jgi:hypothetical protein